MDWLWAARLAGISPGICVVVSYRRGVLHARCCNLIEHTSLSCSLTLIVSSLYHEKWIARCLEYGAKLLNPLKLLLWNVEIKVVRRIRWTRRRVTWTLHSKFQLKILTFYVKRLSFSHPAYFFGEPARRTVYEIIRRHPFLPNDLLFVKGWSF